MAAEDRAANPAIELVDLWRVYGSETGVQVPALQGVNLQLEPGRFHALRGRSGSGKTTLLNLVGGLDEATRGSVRVFGRDPAGMPEAERVDWRRAQVGFVFQSFGLIPILSALENVELVLRISGWEPRRRAERAAAVLAQVGLADRSAHRPYELSGGQQQRVAIARAIVNAPRLLIADEPTGNLDQATAHAILDLFRRIVDTEGLTLLIATHDPLVGEYADRILDLVDGTVVGEAGRGAGAEILESRGQG